MGRADQKIIPNRYQVVPRTLCFIIHEDELLLLRGAPDKRIWPNRYNGVGGHVKPNEDVYAAARREVREETGLEAQDLRLRGVVNIPVDAQSKRGVMLFIFTAVALARAVYPSSEGAPSEEGVPEWVPAARLSELPLVEDLSTLIPRVLAMGPDAPPFFAHYHYNAQDQLVITFSE